MARLAKKRRDVEVGVGGSSASTGPASDMCSDVKSDVHTAAGCASTHVAAYASFSSSDAIEVHRIVSQYFSIFETAFRGVSPEMLFSWFVVSL